MTAFLFVDMLKNTVGKVLTCTFYKEWTWKAYEILHNEPMLLSTCSSSCCTKIGN